MNPPGWPTPRPTRCECAACKPPVFLEPPMNVHTDPAWTKHASGECWETPMDCRYCAAERAAYGPTDE